MNLVHYAPCPVNLGQRTYDQDKTTKPNGLWMSVGTEWLDWCRGEQFRSEIDWHEHVVSLSDAANLLRLEADTDLDAFTHTYGTKLYPRLDSWYIDWREVASVYDGIIISPYQWSRRLTPHTRWYYGWDCASGCIWNISVVSLSAARQVEFGGVS